jgi:glucose-1-phosphate thymidylyltransferase
MKALVLAGGTGSRLRPLTHTSAKQLLPVANKPILLYTLEAVAEAGCTQVGVIVGDTEGEIRAAVEGLDLGIELTWIRQDEPLGLAHAVLVAEDFLAGEPFLMFLGDNLLKASVRPLVQRFQAEQPDALVLLTRVPDPQRFGVVELDARGAVKALVEKPVHPPSELALVGIYLLGPRIFEAARAIRPSERGELEITDALQWLVDQGARVEAEEVVGWWKDTGKPEDLLEANRLVLSSVQRRVEGEVSGSALSGAVVVEAGARVIDSVLLGPVIVASGALVERSVVGPDVSLSTGVHLQDCSIEDAVVMADSEIRGVSGLSGCLLGRGVRIGPAEGRRSLVLGDSCKVEL